MFIMPENAYETYGVKYIGSKKKLIPHLHDIITKNNLNVLSAIDVFTGTTRVGQFFKKKGYKVLTSDLSWAAESYSNTFIIGNNNDHLLKYIDHLNTLKGTVDWITTNYCDVKANGKKQTIVRVWQPKNGMKADAIRNEIDNLDLLPWEKHTLITSLIFALDKVDNTVGVQQAYLKNWCGRSYGDLTLTLPKSISGKKGNHIVGNALQITYPDYDLAYLDPPYSGHSYAGYYHIWDSISRWDKPETANETNKRIDRTKVDESKVDKSMISEWNSDKTAGTAFDTLLSRLKTKYVIISYNDESIISYDSLMKICLNHGTISVTEIDYKRNIMSQIGNAKDIEHKKTRNKELMILITR